MIAPRHFTERQMNTSKRFTFARYVHWRGMQWVIRYVGATGAFQYTVVVNRADMYRAAGVVRRARDAVRSAMKSKQTLLQGASK